MLVYFSKMQNYSSFFSVDEIVNSVNFLLRSGRYETSQIRSLSDFKQSDLARHHRSKKNFWKDVVEDIIKKHGSGNVFRKTLSKYATAIYHDFRNNGHKYVDILGYLTPEKVEGKYMICKYLMKKASFYLKSFLCVNVSPGLKFSV